MEIAGRRAGAIILALCTIAVGALWAPPRAEAATCQSIPASTPGTDIAINGEPHRVPGISNVVLCVDQGSVPVPRVSTEGRGTCQFACLSILIPAGSIDAGGATISFNVDTTPQTHVIDPGGAPGPGEACLLSVGGPDAPYPICKPGISIGPDIEDPTEGVLPFVQNQVEAAEQVVNDAVADGIETVTGAVEDALALVDSFEDDVAALQQYALETAGNLETTTCNAIPPMHEYDSWGYGTPVYFCQEPTRWVVAAAASLNDDVEALRRLAVDLVENVRATTCNTIPPMYEWDPWYGYQEVRFCEDPVRWTTVATNNAYSTTCYTIPPMYDEWGYPVYFCDDALRWTTIALKPVRDAIDRLDLCINPRCIDPIMIHLLLARLQTV